MKKEEENECKNLVLWLRAKSIPHHHSANEVPLHSIAGTGPNGKPIWKGNFATMARLKAMGVAKGFPDYIVIIPADKSRSGKALMLAIEMKRIQGGTTSPEQKQWLSLLGQINDCEGFICKGFQEAKEVIEQFIK